MEGEPGGDAEHDAPPPAAAPLLRPAELISNLEKIELLLEAASDFGQQSEHERTWDYLDLAADALDTICMTTDNLVFHPADLPAGGIDIFVPPRRDPAVPSAQYPRRASSRFWTAEEERQFMEALHVHGENIDQLAHAVPTRTRKQIRKKLEVRRRNKAKVQPIS